MSYFLVAQKELHVYYFVNQLPKLTSLFNVRRQMNSLFPESLYNDQSKFIVGRTFNPVAWNSGTGLSPKYTYFPDVHSKIKAKDLKNLVITSWFPWKLAPPTEELLKLMVF